MTRDEARQKAQEILDAVKQQTDILIAYADGKIIQYKKRNSTAWTTPTGLETLSFIFSENDYRVKPDTNKWAIGLFKDNTGRLYHSRYTLDSANSIYNESSPNFIRRICEFEYPLHVNDLE